MTRADYYLALCRDLGVDPEAFYQPEVPSMKRRDPITDEFVELSVFMTVVVAIVAALIFTETGQAAVDATIGFVHHAARALQ